MTALDGYLRRGLLPSLPEQAVIVIAGRRPPDPALVRRRLGRCRDRAASSTQCPTQDALSLLAAYGLSDDRAPAVVEWAEGSPLALALAADTAAADSDWIPAEGAERPEIVRALIRRLAETRAAGRAAVGARRRRDRARHHRRPAAGGLGGAEARPEPRVGGSDLTLRSRTPGCARSRSPSRSATG